MPGGIGTPEIIIIALIVLVLFGARRIPELAKGLGQGIKEFRKASSDIKKEIEENSKNVEDAVKGSEKETSK